MTDTPLPKLPPIRVLRQRVTELKRIDLRTADIEILKQQLELFFKGFSVVSPVLATGQILYRGVRWADKPANRERLGHPPPEAVPFYQRANRPHHPMFYSSIAREAPFFELDVQPGDHVAISKWRTTKKILVNNVGFASETFRALKSNRTPPTWGPPHSLTTDLSNQLIAKYFAEEFTRVVSVGQEYLYKISTAIAEKLYIGNVNMAVSGDAFEGEARFGGLLYPTIAMRANSENVVLLPEFVDRFLELMSVEWVRVDSKEPDFKYKVTVLDYANSFSSTGEIEWKGRGPEWKVHPGQQVMVSVENGKFIVRNERGEEVDPT